MHESTISHDFFISDSWGNGSKIVGIRRFFFEFLLIGESVLITSMTAYYEPLRFWGGDYGLECCRTLLVVVVERR